MIVLYYTKNIRGSSKNRIIFQQSKDTEIWQAQRSLLGQFDKFYQILGQILVLHYYRGLSKFGLRRHRVGDWYYAH